MVTEVLLAAFAPLLPVGALLYGVYRLGVWRERRRWRNTPLEARPVTVRQAAYIDLLCEERGIDPPDMTDMTMSEASETIDRLKRSDEVA